MTGTAYYLYSEIIKYEKERKQDLLNVIKEIYCIQPKNF